MYEISISMLLNKSGRLFALVSWKDLKLIIFLTFNTTLDIFPLGVLEPHFTYERKYVALILTLTIFTKNAGKSLW